MSWYIVITDEMRGMALSGNDLLVYAAIHGYCQRGDGCYYGGQDRLAEMCGITSRTLRNILSKLASDGYIIEEPVIIDGHARMAYRLPSEAPEIQPEKISGTGKNFRSPAEKISGGQSPHLISDDNKDIYINNPPLSARVAPQGAARAAGVPSLDDVRAYWAAARLAGNPEQFFDHFQANGWKVGGKTPMKDWQAAARNWSRRELEGRRTTRAPRKENYVEAAMRVARNLGIDSNPVNTQNDADEQ